MHLDDAAYETSLKRTVPASPGWCRNSGLGLVIPSDRSSRICLTRTVSDFHKRLREPSSIKKLQGYSVTRLLGTLYRVAGVSQTMLVHQQLFSPPVSLLPFLLHSIVIFFCGPCSRTRDQNLYRAKIYRDCIDRSPEAFVIFRGSG